MKSIYLLAVLILQTTSFGSSDAYALSSRKVFGDWIVTFDKDPMLDSQTNVVAINANRTNRHAGIIAVRCMNGELSLALMPGRKLSTGEHLTLDYSVDRQLVLRTRAAVVSEALIKVETTKEMVQQMVAAKQYAFRIIAPSPVEYVYRAGRGGQQAIAEVTKVCALEE